MSYKTDPYLMVRTETGVATLVAQRPILRDSPYVLFCTISPNPNVQIACNKLNNPKKTLKRPYGKLPQRVQYDYCMKMFTEYLSFCEDPTYVGVCELNSKGDVHFHILL